MGYGYGQAVSLVFPNGGSGNNGWDATITIDAGRWFDGISPSDFSQGAWYQTMTVNIVDSDNNPISKITEFVIRASLTPSVYTPISELQLAPAPLAIDSFGQVAGHADPGPNDMTYTMWITNPSGISKIDWNQYGWTYLWPAVRKSDGTFVISQTPWHPDTLLIMAYPTSASEGMAKFRVTDSDSGYDSGLIDAVSGDWKQTDPIDRTLDPNTLLITTYDSEGTMLESGVIVNSGDPLPTTSLPIGIMLGMQVNVP